MAFAPSDAYIILGHGQEPELRPPGQEILPGKFKAREQTIGTISNDGFNDFDSVFIVPDNCMIVVKAEPGELIYMRHVIDGLNVIGSSEKQDLFRNPLSNTKQLVKELGSVVIYKPGDLCPNFVYELFLSDTQAYWDWAEGDNALSHFGLVQTPLKKPITFIHNELDDSVVDCFNAMYSESIVPTKEVVIDRLLREFTEKNIDLMELYDHDVETEGTYIKNIRRFFTITQKQLLQIGDDGIAKRPGVYYNFICRFMDTGKASYMKYNEVHNKNVTDIESVVGQPKLVRRLVNRKISEAETKRKPLIRNLYTGGKRKTRKAKRQKNRCSSRIIHST